jgi:hypothetical protein
MKWHRRGGIRDPRINLRKFIKYVMFPSSREDVKEAA